MDLGLAIIVGAFTGLAVFLRNETVGILFSFAAGVVWLATVFIVISDFPIFGLSCLFPGFGFLLPGFNAIKEWRNKEG